MAGRKKKVMLGLRLVERFIYDKRSSIRGEERMDFSDSRTTTNLERCPEERMSSEPMDEARLPPELGEKFFFCELMAAMSSLSFKFWSGRSLVSV